MSSTFPLLKLPLVPLANVFNTVDLKEQLNISLCSKKSSKLTKSIRNKSKKVDITFVPANSEVSIARDGIDLETMEHWSEIISLFYAFDISELPEGQHEQLNIGDMIVSIRKGDNDSLNTYWEDKFIGITKLLDYVTDFFDSPIHELVLGGQRYPWDLKRTVDWTMRRQGSIASVQFGKNFECNEIEEEELKYFLDTCKITHDLDLVVRTSEQFKHTIHFEMEKFELKHAHWLSLDNLFSLNCRFILGLLALRRNEQADMRAIVAGLNAVLRTYNKNKVFKVLTEDGKVGFRIVFNNSYDIRRNDGVMGSIVHYPDSYPYRGFIGFLVWPDWENTPYS